MHIRVCAFVYAEVFRTYVRRSMCWLLLITISVGCCWLRRRHVFHESTSLGCRSSMAIQIHLQAQGFTLWARATCLLRLDVCGARMMHVCMLSTLASCLKLVCQNAHTLIFEPSLNHWDGRISIWSSTCFAIIIFIAHQRACQLVRCYVNFRQLWAAWAPKTEIKNRISADTSFHCWWQSAKESLHAPV